VRGELIKYGKNGCSWTKIKWSNRPHEWSIRTKTVFFLSNSLTLQIIGGFRSYNEFRSNTFDDLNFRSNGFR
jgi:hypothetical protein